MRNKKKLSDKTWISWGKKKVKYQDSMHLPQQLLMEKKAVCYAVQFQQMDHSRQ
jgi:hypothetical protein